MVFDIDEIEYIELEDELEFDFDDTQNLHISFEASSK